MLNHQIHHLNLTSLTSLTSLTLSTTSPLGDKYHTLPSYLGTAALFLWCWVSCLTVCPTRSLSPWLPGRMMESLTSEERNVKWRNSNKIDRKGLHEPVVCVGSSSPFRLYCLLCLSWTYRRWSYDIRKRYQHFPVWYFDLVSLVVVRFHPYSTLQPPIFFFIFFIFFYWTFDLCLSQK